MRRDASASPSLSTRSSPVAHAFGRDRRVRRRADFQRAQGTGKRVTTPHFVLLLSARPEDGPSRLGLVVSRKVGPSVERSRVKRVCREVFRTSPGLVPDGIDLVVVARAGAPSLAADDVRREWCGVERFITRRAAEELARRDSSRPTGAPPPAGASSA